MSKNWQRTKTPSLLRHQGGLYYARLHFGGKSEFVPLKTNLLEIARKRHAEHKAHVEATRKAVRKAKAGIASMRDLLALYRERAKNRAGVSDKTRMLNLDAANYIEKTWPGFSKLRPEEISVSLVEEWKTRARQEGTGFRPPGSKGEGRGKSASSFNKAVDALRKMGVIDKMADIFSVCYCDMWDNETAGGMDKKSALFVG